MDENDVTDEDVLNDWIGVGNDPQLIGFDGKVRDFDAEPGKWYIVYDDGELKIQMQCQRINRSHLIPIAALRIKHHDREITVDGATTLQRSGWFAPVRRCTSAFYNTFPPALSSSKMLSLWQCATRNFTLHVGVFGVMGNRFLNFMLQLKTPRSATGILGKTLRKDVKEQRAGSND